MTRLFGRLAFALLMLGLRLTLLVSPRPTVLLVRQLFAKGDAARAKRLGRWAASGVSVTRDLRYGSQAEATLDLYKPQGQTDAPPLVVWTPGGAFVGGNNRTMDYYFTRLAAAGFAVAALGYTRAPEARYPTPPLQLLAALGYLDERAEGLGLDTSRIVLAGDSAGAHVTAQAATAVVDPDYAALTGLRATTEARRLRGIVLCCGVYDLVTLGQRSPLAPVIDGIGWAYSGVRRFREVEAFVQQVSLIRHVTSRLPASFMTVGNGDPLRGQTDEMAAALAGAGVTLEKLVYPDSHSPILGHEYQFDLDLEDARTAFDLIVAFIQEQTRRQS